jgi:2-haloacid dehalogenase
LLNTVFLTSTLSNGNVKLLEDLQRHNSLPFKHINGAEHFGAYKPSPEAYNGAARRFGFENSQYCLVAAHLEGLQAAKRPRSPAWEIVIRYLAYTIFLPLMSLLFSISALA